MSVGNDRLAPAVLQVGVSCPTKQNLAGLGRELATRDLALNNLKQTMRLASLAFVLSMGVSVTAFAQQNALPEGHPPIGNASVPGTHSSTPMGSSVTGRVIETMDSGGYTYVQVDAGARSVWAAAPQFPVNVGDRVSVPTESPMQNYRSDTLARTFPLIYFEGKIRVAGAGANIAKATDKSTPHPGSGRAVSASKQSLVGITKADGGRTVGEVFDGGRGLAGSEVAIRGRVVKFSPRIMGTNWLHLQDGTAGKNGSNDLIVTTDDAASVGDLVLIRGVVSADRDFGYGYTYDLMVEGAKVAVE